MPSLWKDSPAHSINAFQPSDITNEGLIYSQNYEWFGLGGKLKPMQFQTPAMASCFCLQV